MIDLTLTLHTIVSRPACKDFGIQESLSLFPKDGLKKLILKKVFSIFSANFQGWLFSSIYVLPIVPQSDSLFKIIKLDEILKGWNKLSNFLVMNHHYNNLLCMSEKKEKKKNRQYPCVHASQPFPSCPFITWCYAIHTLKYALGWCHFVVYAVSLLMVIIQSDCAMHDV